MNRLASLAATTALAALAACATPPSSPNAGPGQVGVSPGQAASAFQQVCVANRGNTAGILNTLAQGPYILSTEVNLYYHQQLDLSFGVGQRGTWQECIMRWRGSSTREAYEGALDQVSPGARVGYNREFDVFDVSTGALN